MPEMAFLVYPSLKVQIFIFVFFLGPNIIAQAQFFIAQEETVLMRNSRPPILVMKKLGVLQFVSSIEYFDHY